MFRRALATAGLPALVLLLAACGGGDEQAASGRGGGGGRPGGAPGGFGGAPREAAAVPVEVTAVERRDLASYIETNGTLEAESEVDLVARTAGPIVELAAEENMAVRKGQILARIDSDETRARLEISRVSLDEAQTAYDRAEKLTQENLLSSEEFEQATARLESARAEFRGNEIQLGYTEIKAPFSGLIVRRYVKFAETVSNNQALFRLSDFDPLLCPIQVPERELPRLAAGQGAYVTVDAWPDERFSARVLRLSPVVDAATGTVKVTLEVEAAGKLRPGMFASVFLQTDTREGALVIPRVALALDSIGDAVFVADGKAAARREVTLGVREGEYVEVVAGLSEGDPVVSVGQDSLTDGTPIEILDAAGAVVAVSGDPEAGGEGEGEGQWAGRGAGQGGPPGGPGGRGGGESEMTPERLEMIKQRMRDRGMSDEEIDQRLEQMRERFGGQAGGEASSDDQAASDPASDQ